MVTWPWTNNKVHTCEAQNKTSSDELLQAGKQLGPKPVTVRQTLPCTQRRDYDLSATRLNSLLHGHQTHHRLESDALVDGYPVKVDERRRRSATKWRWSTDSRVVQVQQYKLQDGTSSRHSSLLSDTVKRQHATRKLTTHRSILTPPLCPILNLDLIRSIFREQKWDAFLTISF